jgi:hypothetical protein
VLGTVWSRHVEDHRDTMSINSTRFVLTVNAGNMLTANAGQQ